MFFACQVVGAVVIAVSVYVVIVVVVVVAVVVVVVVCYCCCCCCCCCCCSDLQRYLNFPMPGDVQSLDFCKAGKRVFLAVGSGKDVFYGKSEATQNTMSTSVWEIVSTEEKFENRKSRESIYSVIWTATPIKQITSDCVVYALGFSPCTNALAVGRSVGEDHRIGVYLVDRDFEEASSIGLQCSKHGVQCLSWCWDSRHLAFGYRNNQIGVWDYRQQDTIINLSSDFTWLRKIVFCPATKQQ